MKEQSQEQNQLWKKFVSIPHQLIVDKSISTIEFYLYFLLKKHMNHSTWKTKTSQHMLKKNLNIADNRTLIGKLRKLKESKYIDYNFDKFPNKAEFIEIKIINLKSQYESLDLELYEQINKVINIDLLPQAIRLIYYYIKNYNPDFDSMGIKGLACPSYTEINKECKIKLNDITVINNIFHENMICEVIEGEWYLSEYFNKPMKGRNRYIPNIIINTKNHERRYHKHITVRKNNYIQN